MEQLKPWQIEPGIYESFINEGSYLIDNGRVALTLPTMNQILAISQLLQGEEALVPVSAEEIAQAIEQQHSFVALDKEEEQQVIGYQSMGVWENLELVELRSAEVHKDYRGRGINSVMKLLMIAHAQALYPNYPIIGFTEAASKSRGILKKMGFTEQPMSAVKDQWQELGSICPADCYLKNGVECGCKVFLLNNGKS